MAEKKQKTFEEELKELEEIVTELEKGEIPLDSAIEKFNEAMKLASICDEKLKKAEEMLVKIVNDDGSTKDFEVEGE